MQIAVYGKGGIGKSTVSANLSAALALKGEKVLQIGCDPKHDSTRLLHHGQKVVTVLDYILNTPEDAQDPKAILMQGFSGTGCIEAGGPKPGMGCAGRGILTCFEFLNKHSVLDPYGTIVYDVLGDVVCGGFAVPARKRYAEAVYIVSSGEAMSLYAANNILQGIRNLDPDGRRIAGIIYNSRGSGDEKSRVFEFAEAVGLPVCVSIPRSEAFSKAEKLACTLAELDGSYEEAQLFSGLAEMILQGPELFTAQPVSEEAMELFLQGKPFNVTPGGKATRPALSASAPSAPAKGSVSVNAAPAKKKALSDPFGRVPLFGCAFRGAVDLAVHVKDAAVLCHAPKSCTWYAVNGITSYSRRGLFDRGVLYPAFIPRQFGCTDIDIHDAVYGGAGHAREKSLELADRGIKTIIAVTACIPGLSGDDLEPLKEELKARGTDMYIVRTDGVEAGDYNDGMALCYRTLADEAIQAPDAPDADSINIVYEQTWSSRTDGDYEAMKRIFDALGIKVNCRFLCATSIEDVRRFRNAPCSIMARRDRLGAELKAFLQNKYGCRFVDGCFPEGFKQTADLVCQLGKLYSKERRAEALISENLGLYRAVMAELKERFCGTRTMVFLSRKNDWLAELTEDLGLDVVCACVPQSAGAPDTGWGRRFSAGWAEDRDRFAKKTSELDPELILTSDPSVVPDPRQGVSVITVPGSVLKGFFGAAEEARKWARLLDADIKGRWRDDRSVFEKYYS
ncbi:MAG: AAA family ATPase [Clostridia bacterium]|nr:AAA family ATPase [Clostridia bacterium]